MAIATTATTLPEADNVVRLDGIRWKTYKALLRAVERAGSNMRLTYDRGSLEIMAPAFIRESPKRLIARMIETLTEELNIPIRSGSATTFKRRLKRRGLEPDECYWIQNESRVRELKELDLSRDLPADLAIEVENTNRLIERIPIYAALEFPEVWRYDGESLEAGLLQSDGTYAWGDVSACFPFLKLSELRSFLQHAYSTDETTWIRGFRAWVQAELAPRTVRGA
jgi:Uma2 family endonuclease